MYLTWIGKFISTDDCSYYTYNNCPGDGWCSDQGWCDICTGTCDCYGGYQGSVCQGKNFLYLNNEK